MDEVAADGDETEVYTTDDEETGVASPDSDATEVYITADDDDEAADAVVLVSAEEDIEFIYDFEFNASDAITPEQKLFIDMPMTPGSVVLLQAVAGSGKSTTVVNSTVASNARCPGASTCLTAFNTAVRDTLAENPKVRSLLNVHVCTGHGFAIEWWEDGGREQCRQHLQERCTEHPRCRDADESFKNITSISKEWESKHLPVCRRVVYERSGAESDGTTCPLFEMNAEVKTTGNVPRRLHVDVLARHWRRCRVKANEAVTQRMRDDWRVYNRDVLSQFHLPDWDPTYADTFPEEDDDPLEATNLRTVMRSYVYNLMLAKHMNDIDLFGNWKRVFMAERAYRYPLSVDAMPQFDKVLVDEAQDCTPLDFYVYAVMRRRGCQLCFVGDPRQSLYSFRGSVDIYDTDVFNRFFEGVVPIRLTLSRTFRNPSVIVDEARKHAPGLVMVPSRIGGSVRDMRSAAFPAFLREHGHKAFVLTHTNQVLLQLLLQLDEGRVTGERLCMFVTKGFKTMLVAAYKLPLWKKASASDEYAQEKLTLSEPAKKAFGSVEECEAFCDRLEDSTSSGKPFFSTVHSAKGLEAEVVILHRTDIMRQEDANVHHVAITRCSDELWWLLP
jgi:hypothetical protein